MELYEVVQFYLKMFLLIGAAVAGALVGIKMRKRKNEKEGQE